MKSKATHDQRESLLDFLRWIAALLVAFSHWTSEVPYLFRSGLPNFLLPIAKVGEVGVPIFFIVSGYVISLTAANKASGLRFAYARFVRLFPGLLISMLVVLVVGQRFISPYSQPVDSLLASVSLTHDIFEIQPLTPVLWTLIVEVKFYFAITVILLIKRDIFQKPLWIATLLISLLILKETSLFGIYNYFNSQLLGNIQFFLLGISLHFSTRLVRKHALMALGYSILSATYVPQILDLDEFRIRDRLISFALVLIIFSSYIQFPSKLATFFNSLGLASYPIYLVHTHLGTAMINILYVRIENVTFVFLVGGVLALTLFCISINLFTEKPFQKALRRFERFN